MNDPYEVDLPETPHRRLARETKTIDRKKAQRRERLQDDQYWN